MDKREMAKVAMSNKVTPFAAIKLIVLSVVGLVMTCTLIFLAVDFNNSSEQYVEQAKSINDIKINSKEQFKKQYEYVRDKEAEKIANESKNNGTLGKLGAYDIRYYVMFPIYEGGMSDVNGNGDGGFGPIQATNSALPRTIEYIYNSKPDEFSWLEPYAKDRTLYMNGEKSTDSGSKKLKQLVDTNVISEDQKKLYYDLFMEANESTYLERAIRDLENLTGKGISEVGPGTVATLFSMYIRWGAGSKPKILAGCVSSMSDDELIDKMFSNAYTKAVGDKPRWKCGASIAKGINSGTINVYGQYSCDGSCGSTHATKPGATFGELFGRE